MAQFGLLSAGWRRVIRDVKLAAKTFDVASDASQFLFCR